MPLSAVLPAAALGSLLLGLPLAAGQWGSVGGEDLVICGQWSEKLDDMNEVCCADEPGGQCANGFPSTCSHACAGVFSNFNDGAFFFSSWSSPSSQSADLGLLAQTARACSATSASRTTRTT